MFFIFLSEKSDKLVSVFVDTRTILLFRQAEHDIRHLFICLSVSRITQKVTSE